MTEQEAIDLAAKREKHKSKHMTHKRWAAVHDSVKGWHVALIDSQAAIAKAKTQEANDALQKGDLAGFMNAGAAAIIAGALAEMEG